MAAVAGNRLMGMADVYIPVCNRCLKEIPKSTARANENWCSPECEPVQMWELRVEIARLSAIEEKALEMLEEFEPDTQQRGRKERGIARVNALLALREACFPVERAHV